MLFVLLCFFYTAASASFLIIGFFVGAVVGITSDVAVGVVLGITAGVILGVALDVAIGFIVGVTFGFRFESFFTLTIQTYFFFPTFA